MEAPIFYIVSLILNVISRSSQQRYGATKCLTCPSFKSIGPHFNPVFLGREFPERRRGSASSRIALSRNSLRRYLPLKNTVEEHPVVPERARSLLGKLIPRYRPGSWNDRVAISEPAQANARYFIVPWKNKPGNDLHRVLWNFDFLYHLRIRYAPLR